MPKKKAKARKPAPKKARRKSAKKAPARKINQRRAALKKVVPKYTVADLDGPGTMDPPGGDEDAGVA